MQDIHFYGDRPWAEVADSHTDYTYTDLDLSRYRDYSRLPECLICYVPR